MHDPTFVNEVLEDFLRRCDIRNETIIVSSGNAPTQYKKKNAFFYMLSLADRFNAVIVKIFGAAGHEKELIDVVSSFGVKSILHCDIITLDK